VGMGRYRSAPRLVAISDQRSPIHAKRLPRPLRTRHPAMLNQSRSRRSAIHVVAATRVGHRSAHAERQLWRQCYRAVTLNVPAS
jgi:hypothetical protein